MSQAEMIGQIVGTVICGGLAIAAPVAAVIGLIVAIRKRATAWIVAISIIGVPVLALSALMLLGILFRLAGEPMRSALTGAKESKTSELTQTVTATDGQCTVRMPDDWKSIPTLNEAASLQVGSRRRDAYIVIFTTDKKDMALHTLDEFAENRMHSLTSNSSDATVSESTTLEIGGRSTLQYELRKTVNDVHIVYLIAFVDGRRNFHEMLAWTVPSRFEDNKAQMQQIIESFQELDAPRPAPKPPHVIIPEAPAPPSVS